MVDYFSFEDVLHELELGEEELKRMVSEGELRAFRDENKMKFKKEDVENLKKGRITEPTIILPSTPASEKTDETVLDLDIGAESEALNETSTSSSNVEFSEESIENVAAAETDDDLIVTEPTEAGTEPEETFIEEETNTGLSTEPLRLADDAGGEETVEAEIMSDDAEVAAPVGRRGGSRMSRRIATTQAPVAVEEELERARAHPVWTLFLLLTVVVSLMGTVFFYDLMRIESGASDRPMGMASGMAKWMLGNFWGDADWVQFHKREFPDNGTATPPFKDASGDPQLQYNPDVYKGPSFEIDDAPPRAEAVH